MSQKTQSRQYLPFSPIQVCFIIKQQTMGLSDRDWNTYKNKTSIFLRVFVCVYVCMCVRTIKPSVNRYSYSVKTPSTVVYTGHKAPPTH